MALQSEAIENRLEGLKQDSRRMMFDSKIREFRHDGQGIGLHGDRAAKLKLPTDAGPPVDLVVSLIEELSRRLDGLEQRNRSISEEIRQQDRRAKRRISFAIAGGIFGAALLYGCRMMHWV